VGSGVSNKAKFQVSSNKTPLYGVSSEPESGIILDNFSFRGITGVELKKMDSKMLQELNNSGYYDLIVFQYGVNLMFKPDDTNYDYYYRAMKNVLKKFKKNMPDTEFLLLSCSDRAFNYDGEWKTAVGIDSLINVQAKLAYNNKLTFYNFYKSIGGNGTIVKWADSTVKLANKDYVHFNFRGANAVAKTIYKALINDYNKAVKIKNPNSQIKQISNTIVKKEAAI
jgi:lysophospholipase L1-like esterase